MCLYSYIFFRFKNQLHYTPLLDFYHRYLTQSIAIVSFTITYLSHVYKISAFCRIIIYFSYVCVSEVAKTLKMIIAPCQLTQYLSFSAVNSSEISLVCFELYRHLLRRCDKLDAVGKVGGE